MNSTYNQLVKNLEYLKMKQMITHLNEVIDFTTNNNLSFVDALIKSCPICGSKGELYGNFDKFYGLSYGIKCTNKSFGVCL